MVLQWRQHAAFQRAVFNLQHPRRLLTAVVSPAPGYILPSSGLRGHCTHMNMFIHRNAYLHIIKNKNGVNLER